MMLTSFHFFQMRVEGLSANKSSHFSVILEVNFSTLLTYSCVTQNQSLFFFTLVSACLTNHFETLKVFKVAPTFLMVDIQNAAGDAEEYLKVSSSRNENH